MKQPPQPAIPPLQEPLSEPQESTDSAPINENQLIQMANTLKKFKHILKQGQLTSYKKKNIRANRIFSQMSTLFHMKKNRLQAKKYHSKEKRIQSRKKQQAKMKFQGSMKKVKHMAQFKPIIVENQSEQHSENSESEQQYRQPLCHICRTPFSQAHQFYSQLCLDCAHFNFLKRQQKVDLSGLTALVTGGRIKIGFQISLKLLRGGARVFATSRFASNALIRFKSQPDFNEWKHDLTIIQCDFVSQKQVDELISLIKYRVQKLDILINNAAQTIVRPREFYTKELQQEQLALQHENEEAQPSLVKICPYSPLPSLFSSEIAVEPGQIDLSQLDDFGQPTDKRKVNTWIQSIQDVSLVDCYTTQIINSIVPFHLISQLKDKMKGSSPSWVINVSAMEGVFGRYYKSNCHPHTNMAKAALNMITRTCAEEFKREGIFMNSVDTGWITNENPHQISQWMKHKKHFQLPLDCVDGAMRVLDPIYQGIRSNKFPYGHFLKNYKVSSW